MKLARWLPHGVCLLALGAELVGWRLRHRTDAELAELARHGDAESRIAALHQLANRSKGSAKLLPSETVLAHDGDPRIREFLLTADFLRQAPFETRRTKIALVRELLKKSDDAETLRTAFVLLNQCDMLAERSLFLPRQEIEWVLAADDGRAPPHDELKRYLLERYPLAQLDSAKPWPGPGH